MLRVEGLAVRYGAIAAVKEVSLEVQRGELVTIIGANGAGKSTLLKAVCGLVRPAAGKVIFDGADITGMSSQHLVRRGLALVPEGRAIVGRLSVEDNLWLGAHVRRKPSAETMELCFSVFPQLRQRRKMIAGLLSGGEQQMLAISRALLSEPRLVCLDEPSLGLAPIIVEHIFGVMDRLRKEKDITIVLVEQNAHMALSVASRAYVLETGRVALSGTTEEVLQNPRVHEAYLGASFG